METENKGMGNPEDVQPQPAIDASANESQMTPENAEEHKRHHHSEHGNRRYKMFSNHSSANDMPHTNTSF
ncbi:MAG TPA: hypothetical protein VK623_01735 [Flavobacterium sp.]|nr:hypothetical protein [Flavobacterium sp.]